ncbi:MAG: GTPase domain-containing protein [Deltaproteobacteria bacterium]|nr:GTPase domain-containing protein [Deltaproteobacteria bacterium]
MTATMDHSDSLKPENFRVTGLTPDGLKIPGLAKDMLRRFAILAYKRANPCLWVVFLGGTGTGKSTLFNAFCGRPLSATGVERPKTAGPVAHAHGQCPLEKVFPFPEINIVPIPPEDMDLPHTGKAGQLAVLATDEVAFSHLVLVDTPDLDSVEEKNHAVAKDLYHLSDAVVFVASQEKYADEVLHDFFMRVLQDEKPYFFILNKASSEATREEILSALQEQGLGIHGANLWMIPHTTPGRYDRIAGQKPFIRLKNAFFQAVNHGQAQQIKLTAGARATRVLKKDVSDLQSSLDREAQAVEGWLKDLQALTHRASAAYVQNQKERFSKTSGQYLRVEIRKLFSRYDLLAKPRQAVRNILKAPLRLMGLSRKNSPADRKAGLLKVRKNVAFTPVQESLAKYNVSVLKNLSPSHEDAPLFKSLRNPDLPLTETEIRQYILEAQEALAQWLEETFEALAKGIPTGKKVGIYSTSVLWGILILTFEVAVGGGFTVLDAALDSALAPFVTKGAVEIFAYHEIRKIAKELAMRYQEGLLSILRRQEERYEACIQSLTTSPRTRKALDALLMSVSEHNNGK